MSTTPLASLLVENLRGSILPFKLAFEKGKKLTIVYGENGTGKSTLGDAFDLLGNGTVGSLDTRGLGTTRKYWPAVGKTATEVKVTIETVAGSCSVTLGSSDVVVTNEALRPQVSVLRRGQILRLIEAKPADRYQEIRQFVDVSGVEASETTLRKLIIDKKRDFETATTRVSENRSEIDRFWSQAGSPAGGAIVWADEETRKDPAILDQRKTQIDKLIGLWDNLRKHPQKIGDLGAQQIVTETASFKANSEVEALQNTVASDYLEVLEILRVAQTHFQKHPNPTVCPLCESSEKANGLAHEVDRRIQSQGVLSQLDAAKKSAGIKLVALQQAVQRVNDAKSVAIDDLNAFTSFCHTGTIPADLLLPTLPAPTDLSQLETWLANHQVQRNQWKLDSDKCAGNQKFIAALKSALAVMRVNEGGAKALESILPRLQQTLELVEGERKKFTDAILAAISKRVGELYDMVHPGEGINKINLALDAVKRASLEISTEFGGRIDSPPQAYFSDSHLDTLGLCVFLALAERMAPEDKILVLDDVLGSVDEPHVDRVIEMIYEESTKFRHCLVTTHYGPWRHKFRWGWLKNGQCQFVELTKWSLQKGISHIRSLPETDRLRTMLQETSPDLQSICSKAGVVLEAILDFLTLLYECNIPRRLGGVYTLGDLLPAIDGKLKKALRVEHRQENELGVVSYSERRLEPHLTELTRIMQVRNVSGCHFNAISFALLDDDSIAFGTEVLALADSLIDQDVGWPRNEKSGSFWATTGETRRLHPLRKPS